MESITTYHATLDPPDAFRDGFRPLSHFGSPRAGLWQVGRKLTYMRSNFPNKIYVYEVELELGRILELPDYDSPKAEVLLRFYMERNNIPNEQYEKWKGALPFPAGSRENDGAAAFFLKLEGWDIIKYQNVHEAAGLNFLSHIQVGPDTQAAICWSNLSVKQVSIKKEPHIVALSEFKPAVRELMKYRFDWDTHPFSIHIQSL